MWHCGVVTAMRLSSITQPRDEGNIVYYYRHAHETTVIPLELAGGHPAYVSSCSQFPAHRSWEFSCSSQFQCPLNRSPISSGWWGCTTLAQFSGCHRASDAAAAHLECWTHVLPMNWNMQPGNTSKNISINKMKSVYNESNLSSYSYQAHYNYMM